MKKFLTVVLAIMMVVTCLASCTSSTQGGNNDEVAEEIVIGAIAPLTGSVSVYGTSVKKGFDLAIAEINANGGILGGKTIVLEAMDDQGSATETVNAFNTLLSKGITLIGGAVTSGCTSSITSMANEEGVVLISPSATADTVTTEDDFVFRSCYSDSNQGAMAAKFAKDSGYDKVGVLYCSADTYSKGMYDSFKAACADYGVEIVIEESSADVAATEYSVQLAAIAASGVEFLFAPYYYDVVAPNIVPQAREAGYNGIIMGADGYDGCIGLISEGSDLSAWENVLFTNHYDPASENEAVKAFVAAFEAANGGETPTAFAALAYDAMNMLVAAIEEAGTTDAQAVRDILAKTADFAGVTGTFSLDQSGTPIKGAAIIGYTVENDAVVTKFVTDVSL